ncbi:Neuroserpin, partial [Orchesella cincta]
PRCPAPVHAHAYRTDSQRPRAPKLTEQDAAVLNMKRVLSSANKFSSRLYSAMKSYAPEDSEELTPSYEDLVYSPLTVFTSLLTLRSAASGNTALEIANALAVSKLNDTVVHTGIRLLLQSIQHPSEQGSLNLVNRLFLDHSFSPDHAYVNSVHDDFHGELVQTHFSNASAATQFVNSNMRVSSHGVLENVITHTEDNSTDANASVIDGGLMLVSGFTIEASWEQGFTPLLTRNATFTREDGSSVQLPMMHRDGAYFFGEIPELNASVLSIPYKSSRYVFNVILPEIGIPIAELETNLESFPFPAILSRMTKTHVQVSLPAPSPGHGRPDRPARVNTRHKCFSNEHATSATWSTNPTPELYVTNAVHKTYLDVSEGGSGCTPPTSVIEAVPAQARLLTPFTVNRPFVFFIYDQLLQTTLVVGRKAT